MDSTTVLIVLYSFSTIVHFAILFKYGKSATSVPVGIFGSLYLAISAGLIVDFSWILAIALPVTTLGLIGASVTLKRVPEQREITIVMNVIDVVMIAILTFTLFG